MMGFDTRTREGAAPDQRPARPSWLVVSARDGCVGGGEGGGDGDSEDGDGDSEDRDVVMLGSAREEDDDDVGCQKRSREAAFLVPPASCG